MAFNDLQDFVRHLEGIGQLKRVRVEVDPELEVTEITQRVLREQGPALLFERPKGSSTPLLMNLFEVGMVLALAQRIEFSGEPVESLEGRVR